MSLLAELLTPSGEIGPEPVAYQRAVEAIGHALLGACVPALALWLAGAWWVGVFTFAALYLRLGIAAVYWWAKERGDLRRNGRFADGVVDTGFVWAGTFYGPWWWPLAVMAGAGVVFWWEARK